MAFSLEAASVGVLSEDEWFVIFDEYPASREISDELAIFLEQMIKPYQKREKDLSWLDTPDEKGKSIILEAINSDINYYELQNVSPEYSDTEIVSVWKGGKEIEVPKLVGIDFDKLDDEMKKNLSEKIKGDYTNRSLSADMFLYEDEDRFSNLYNISSAEKSEMKEKLEPVLNSLSLYLGKLPIHEAFSKFLQIMNFEQRIKMVDDGEEDMVGAEADQEAGATLLFAALYAKATNKPDKSILIVTNKIREVNGAFSAIKQDQQDMKQYLEDEKERNLSELKELLQDDKNISVSDVELMITSGEFAKVPFETGSPSLAVQVINNQVKEINMLKQLAIAHIEVLKLDKLEKQYTQLQEKIKVPSPEEAIQAEKEWIRFFNDPATTPGLQKSGYVLDKVDTNVTIAHDAVDSGGEKINKPKVLSIKMQGKTPSPEQKIAFNEWYAKQYQNKLAIAENITQEVMDPIKQQIQVENAKIIAIKDSTDLSQLIALSKEAISPDNKEAERLMESLTEPKKVRIGQEKIEAKIQEYRKRGCWISQCLEVFKENMGIGNISKIKRLRDKHTQTYQEMIQKLNDPKNTISAELEQQKNIAICSLEIMYRTKNEIAEKVKNISGESLSTDPYLLALQQCLQEPDCPAEVKKAQSLIIQSIISDIQSLELNIGIGKPSSTFDWSAETTNVGEQAQADRIKEALASIQKVEMFSSYMSKKQKNQIEKVKTAINSPRSIKKYRG